MTKPLQFDFNAAVAKAQRDYPAEIKHISFADNSAPDAQKKLAAFISKFPLPIRLVFKVPKIWQKHFGDFDSKTTGSRTYALPGLEERLVAIKVQNPDVFPFSKKRASENLTFAFNHELGHAIVPRGMPDTITFSLEPPAKKLWEKASYEIAADVFAALRTLQSGVLTTEHIRSVSLRRASDAWANPLSLDHLTSMALDHLILNEKAIDFVSLTPQEIKAIANDYAQKFSIPQQAMEKAFTAIDTSKKTTNDEFLSALIKTVTEADETAVEFYPAES